MRFKAVMKIDLPGYTIYSPRGKISRFFGRERNPSGEMRVLANTFTLIGQFVSGFKSMGITNAIALKIDNKLIYNDTENRKDDVGRLVAALDRNQDIVDEKFEHLQLAMECKKDGIHYVFDIQVKGREKVGKEEVAIAVSGKPFEFYKKRGEKPETYRHRVKRLVNDRGAMESYEIQFKDCLEDILQKLRFHLGAIGAGIQFVKRPGATAPETGLLAGTGATSPAGYPRTQKIIRKTGSTKQTTTVTFAKHANRTVWEKEFEVRLPTIPADAVLIDFPEIELMEIFLRDIGDF